MVKLYWKNFQKNILISKLASKRRYEIDPNNEYPKNYTRHIIIKTSNDDIINTFQNGLRGEKNKPLLYNEI